MSTVAEFREALDAAYCDLFITWEERNAALQKFIDEQKLPSLSPRCKPSARMSKGEAK
jgi:hypothetical protein